MGGTLNSYHANTRAFSMLIYGHCFEKLKKIHWKHWHMKSLSWFSGEMIKIQTGFVWGLNEKTYENVPTSVTDGGVNDCMIKKIR